MNPRQLPNLIPALRGALALPLLWLILQQHHVAALGVRLLAGASDAVDGYLAKRSGWQSRLGAVLDPIADKLLLTVAVFTVASGVDYLVRYSLRAWRGQGSEA